MFVFEKTPGHTAVLFPYFVFFFRGIDPEKSKAIVWQNDSC